MATKRRNISKSKSKSLSKSNKGSNSRKHLIKSRKSGSKTRKMRGGALKGVRGWFTKLVKPKPKPVAKPPSRQATIFSRQPTSTSIPVPPSIPGKVLTLGRSSRTIAVPLQRVKTVENSTFGFGGKAGTYTEKNSRTSFI